MPETFLDHILAVYRAVGVERATVVWAESARRDPRILHHILHPRNVSLKVTHEFHDDPSADRLASVIRGLRSTDGASSIFLQDVDRPFITASVLTALLACEEYEGFAAPDLSGRSGHPLLLSPRIVSALLREPPAGPRLPRLPFESGPPSKGTGKRAGPGFESLRALEWSARSTTLRELLRPYPCMLVSVGSTEEASLLEININTPAEYRRYFPAPFPAPFEGRPEGELGRVIGHPPSSRLARELVAE